MRSAYLKAFLENNLGLWWMQKKCLMKLLGFSGKLFQIYRKISTCSFRRVVILTRICKVLPFSNANIQLRNKTWSVDIGIYPFSHVDSGLQMPAIDMCANGNSVT